jgi:putative endonuclease
VTNLTPSATAIVYLRPMPHGIYFAYIMASRSRTLYVGVTADVRRRAFQHQHPNHPCFTARYNCARLVWFQSFQSVDAAIQREKQLKGWSRAKRIALIEAANPTWEDLSAQWYSHLCA